MGGSCGDAPASARASSCAGCVTLHAPDPTRTSPPTSARTMWWQKRIRAQVQRNDPRILPDDCEVEQRADRRRLRSRLAERQEVMEPRAPRRRPPPSRRGRASRDGRPCAAPRGGRAAPRRPRCGRSTCATRRRTAHRILRAPPWPQWITRSGAPRCRSTPRSRLTRPSAGSLVRFPLPVRWASASGRRSQWTTCPLAWTPASVLPRDDRAPAPRRLWRTPLRAHPERFAGTAGPPIRGSPSHVFEVDPEPGRGCWRCRGCWDCWSRGRVAVRRLCHRPSQTRIRPVSSPNPARHRHRCGAHRAPTGCSRSPRPSRTHRATVRTGSGHADGCRRGRSNCDAGPRYRCGSRAPRAGRGGRRRTGTRASAEAAFVRAPDSALLPDSVRVPTLSRVPAATARTASVTTCSATPASMRVRTACAFATAASRSPMRGSSPRSAPGRIDVDGDESVPGCAGHVELPTGLPRERSVERQLVVAGGEEYDDAVPPARSTATSTTHCMCLEAPTPTKFSASPQGLRYPQNTHVHRWFRRR